MRIGNTLGAFIAGCVVTLVVVYAVVIYTTGPRGLGEGFRIEDDKLQSRLAERLEEKGIPFRQEEDGTIRYASEHSERVKEIAYDVMGQRPPDKVVLRFPSAEAREEFTSRLASKGVWFAVADGSGGGRIVVEKKDKELWQPIRDRVLEGTEWE